MKKLIYLLIILNTIMIKADNENYIYKRTLNYKSILGIESSLEKETTVDRNGRVYQKLTNNILQKDGKNLKIEDILTEEGLEKLQLLVQKDIDDNLKLPLEEQVYIETKVTLNPNNIYFKNDSIVVAFKQYEVSFLYKQVMEFEYPLELVKEYIKKG
ncbi:hypothetical protein [Cetobacterium sp. ZWU0022]|uniref:hypothetical protein n=1 Tax=Cetobacterium sp. ZWU0022 TaxID=1340502 RepID=UPI0006470B85|nr:hypothetical protein [Cetobacterium sp. ZWU0022]